MNIHLSSKALAPIFFCVTVLLQTGFAHANSSPEQSHPVKEKSNHSAPAGKAHAAANDKDLILAKNTLTTQYLLSGWGKVDGPYIWFTVSTHFNNEQISPSGKLFNLVSASGAMDCDAKSYFYYRMSYLFFDAKSKTLAEVYSEKSKSEVMVIDASTLESSVQGVVCK